MYKKYGKSITNFITKYVEFNIYYHPPDFSPAKHIPLSFWEFKKIRGFVII